MDSTQPVKPEPASPSRSDLDKLHDDEAVYPEIKVEPCYPDLPIEYEPQTEAYNVNVKFTEVCVKVKTDTIETDLSRLHALSVKNEPGFSAEVGGHRHDVGDLDVSLPGIKKECFPSSNGNQPPRRTYKTSAERAREYRARKRAKKPPKKPPKTRLQRNREWRERKKLQAKMLQDPELCFIAPSTSISPSDTLPPIVDGAEVYFDPAKIDTNKDVCKTILKGIKRTKKKKINECAEFKRTFKLRNNLKIHMLSHTEEKPYRCLKCEYRSSRSDVLNSHMLTHSGEKPFSCSSCNYRCARKDVLKSHILIHSGVKPFCCTVCSYSCIRKGNLKYHMLSHT